MRIPKSFLKGQKGNKHCPRQHKISLSSSRGLERSRVFWVMTEYVANVGTELQPKQRYN